MYVGGAVAGLQVMAARARHRRADTSGPASVVAPPPADAAPAAPTPDPR